MYCSVFFDFHMVWALPYVTINWIFPLLLFFSVFSARKCYDKSHYRGDWLWHQKQSCLFLYCIRFKSYQVFVFIMQSWFLLNCYWLVLWMNNLGPYLFPLTSRATCYQRKLIQVLRKKKKKSDAWVNFGFATNFTEILFGCKYFGKKHKSR